MSQHMVASTESSSPEQLSFEKIRKSDSLTDDLIQFPQLLETEDVGDEDNEDALSLCDLPIYGGSNSFSSWDDGCNRNVYEEEANSLFEFLSSGELGGASSFQDADDDDDDERDAIIFCGKPIACKDSVTKPSCEKSSPIPCKDSVTKPSCEKSSPIPGPVNLKPKKRALFSWRTFKIASFTFRKSEEAEASHSYSSEALPSSSSMKKKDKGRRLEKKPSTLLKSPTKSRWYLFMFGQTRFPQAMTMELSDLKSRQRRRCSPSPSMNLRVTEAGADDVGQSSRGRGLWSLLKESATTVSRTHGNDVVRAVGSISLV